MISPAVLGDFICLGYCPRKGGALATAPHAGVKDPKSRRLTGSRANQVRFYGLDPLASATACVAVPIPHFVSSEMVHVIETPCRIRVIAPIR